MIEVLEGDPPYDDYPPTLLRAQMQSAARYRQSGSKTPASIRYPLGQVTASSLFEKQKMIMEIAAFITSWRKTYLAQFPQYSAYKVDDLVAQKMVEEDAHKVPPEIIEAAWKQVGGRRIAPEPPTPEPWSITKKAVVYGGIGLAMVLVLRGFGKRAGHLAGTDLPPGPQNSMFARSYRARPWTPCSGYYHLLERTRKYAKTPEQKAFIEAKIKEAAHWCHDAADHA